MLPELIYREERKEDYRALLLLGLLAGLGGFAVGKLAFPSELDIAAVIFAAIPLIYPLNRFFFEDEKENAPHLPEIKVYGSLFVGLTAAFFILGMLFHDAFNLQSILIGVSGHASSSSVSFASIFLNNIKVFGIILVAATVIGSSGAFILTWNASVVGYFFSRLVKGFGAAKDFLSCSMPDPSPICYLPHSTFEMGGFIIAGIAGSLVSAAVYRQDFEKEIWIDYAKLVALGIGMVVFGAFLETA